MSADDKVHVWGVPVTREPTLSKGGLLALSVRQDMLYANSLSMEQDSTDKIVTAAECCHPYQVANNSPRLRSKSLRMIMARPSWPALIRPPPSYKRGMPVCSSRSNDARTRCEMGTHVVLPDTANRNPVVQLLGDVRNRPGNPCREHQRKRPQVPLFRAELSLGHVVQSREVLRSGPGLPQARPKERVSPLMTR